MFCYVLLNVLGEKRGFIFNEVIAAGKKIRTPLDKLDTSVYRFFITYCTCSDSDPSMFVVGEGVVADSEIPDFRL